jgi:hypothetical protein
MHTVSKLVITSDTNGRQVGCIAFDRPTFKTVKYWHSDAYHEHSVGLLSTSFALTHQPNVINKVKLMRNHFYGLHKQFMMLERI